MIESSLGRLVLVNTELSPCDLDSTVHIDSGQSERATLSAVLASARLLASPASEPPGSLALYSRPHIILEEAQSIVHSPSERFKSCVTNKGTTIPCFAFEIQFCARYGVRSAHILSNVASVIAMAVSIAPVSTAIKGQVPLSRSLLPIL
jgi:hypothetical protein